MPFLRLYNVYILPVLLYGSDTRSMTEASRQHLDAFDQWCLRRILRIQYTAHVTNVSVRSQTDQPLVSSLIQQRRLKLFGHIARAAASEDHSRALRASTDRLPVDWRHVAAAMVVAAVNVVLGVLICQFCIQFFAVQT